MKNEERLQELIKYLDGLHYIHPEEIPSIDLYMDQVTTFMDEHLANLKRYPEDKALTKTMINNYAKNNLLPPPVKKKYSKDHMLMLLFIYYYKGVLSLTDIETILGPLNQHFFQSDKALRLEDIYTEIFSLEDSEMARIKTDLQHKFDQASRTFSAEEARNSDLTEEQRSSLQLFTFLCELGFDVYLKKQLMEKIADQLRQESLHNGKTKNKKV